MNTYRTSDGERVTKGYIDFKITEAKRKLTKQFLEKHGYRFCEVCRRNEMNNIIDWAHIVSVNDCQKKGMTELAWDETNMMSMCRACHNKHDKTY